MTGATEAVTPDHKRIWLSPRCDECDERTWCEDDRGCCDDCGAPNTEYIRADIQASELATLRRRVADMEGQLAEADKLGADYMDEDFALQLDEVYRIGAACLKRHKDRLSPPTRKE